MEAPDIVITAAIVSNALDRADGVYFTAAATARKSCVYWRVATGRCVLLPAPLPNSRKGDLRSPQKSGGAGAPYFFVDIHGTRSSKYCTYCLSLLRFCCCPWVSRPYCLSDIAVSFALIWNMVPTRTEVANLRTVHFEVHQSFQFFFLDEPTEMVKVLVRSRDYPSFPNASILHDHDGSRVEQN